MEPRSTRVLLLWTICQSIKIPFFFFFKNIYLSNCYFCFSILYTSFGTVHKADHCGTKGHFMKAYFPALVHICVVFYRVQCFPSYDLIPYGNDSKPLTLASPSSSPHRPLSTKKTYDPRSLGQGWLICFLKLPWIILMY